MYFAIITCLWQVWDSWAMQSQLVWYEIVYILRNMYTFGTYRTHIRGPEKAVLFHIRMGPLMGVAMFTSQIQFYYQNKLFIGEILQFHF